MVRMVILPMGFGTEFSDSKTYRKCVRCNGLFVCDQFQFLGNEWCHSVTSHPGQGLIQGIGRILVPNVAPNFSSWKDLSELNGASRQTKHSLNAKNFIELCRTLAFCVLCECFKKLLCVCNFVTYQD
jgi:hypothetical protein